MEKATKEEVRIATKKAAIEAIGVLRSIIEKSFGSDTENKCAIVWVHKEWSEEYVKGFFRGVAGTLAKSYGVRSENDYKVTRIKKGMTSEKMGVSLDENEYNGPCEYYEMEIFV